MGAFGSGVLGTVAFPLGARACRANEAPLGGRLAWIFDVVNFCGRITILYPQLHPTNENENLRDPPKHIHITMDSLGAAGMSAFPSDPKTQVMRQVQQEAAMQNARMLVEVHTHPHLIHLIHRHCLRMLQIGCSHSAETQRTLLRALRPQAQRLPLQRRRVVLHRLHGKVHVRLEHGIEDVRGADTEGEPAGCGELVQLFLDGSEGGHRRKLNSHRRGRACIESIFGATRWLRDARFGMYDIGAWDVLRRWDISMDHVIIDLYT